jgi:hypothetical protein
MASNVKNGCSPMNNKRLDTIVTRQRSSRLRDLAFAALVVLAGGLALSSVTAAAHAAATATAGATGQTSVTER